MNECWSSMKSCMEIIWKKKLETSIYKDSSSNMS